MAVQNTLDAHAKPPEPIKSVYKTYQKLSKEQLADRNDLIDPLHYDGDGSLLTLPPALRETYATFLSAPSGYTTDYHVSSEPPSAFEVSSIPGLQVFPSLLPPKVQLQLLDKLLHRDLCNSDHKTNVHMHYKVPYPVKAASMGGLSYFDPSSATFSFEPKDKSIHQAILTPQYLNRKLRWMTLGGQYDWTNKVYPPGSPPAFPSDIKDLIESTFPMKAEAAIVNLYSPGDTLSLHRDVSEECGQPLVSISLGCDGIVVVGLDGEEVGGEARVAVVRLRSGDAVLMSGKSRYAWHGVPKILEGTCPEWMRDWPAVGPDERSSRFGDWRGWMAGKRVNLNVRQMFDGH